MPANPYDLLTDDELDGMTVRAFREAARCWQEYRSEARGGRRYPGGTVALLLNAAVSAQDYHNDLAAAQHLRQRAALDARLDGAR